ncbi:MAG: hypothetical protein ACI8UO_004957 [Verrucomicrobiales bacterium]|jgi:hypothetical protein
MPVPGEAPFLPFIRPLNAAGFRYMVTGSIAAMKYGEMRTTNDVDLVLFLPLAKVRELEKLFPLEEFYCPPAEVLAIEARRATEGHFNLIHHASGFKADVYLTGNDQLRIWGLSQSEVIDYDGEPVPLAPPEYVIARKLEFFRSGGSEKHVRDIRAMLEISGDQIDQQLLAEKIADLGLQKVWEQIKG